jgi:hypothetical protein
MVVLTFSQHDRKKPGSPRLPCPFVIRHILPNPQSTMLLNVVQTKQNVGCNERSELHLSSQSRCNALRLLHPTTTPLGYGGHGFGSSSNPPRGRGKVRSAIRDDGADAAGTGMCRLRRSVRPCTLSEGNRVAVGLAEVAFLLVTFLWPRKEKLLAPARRAGEIPSRPAASRPARQSRATTQRLLPPTPYLGTDDYA